MTHILHSSQAIPLLVEIRQFLRFLQLHSSRSMTIVSRPDFVTLLIVLNEQASFLSLRNTPFQNHMLVIIVFGNLTIENTIRKVNFDGKRTVFSQYQSIPISPSILQIHLHMEVWMIRCKMDSALSILVVGGILYTRYSVVRQKWVIHLGLCEICVRSHWKYSYSRNNCSRYWNHPLNK